MLRNIIPAISWSVLVLFVSLIPGNEIPEFEVGFLHIDKLAHAILFAGLSFFWFFGLKKGGISKIVSLNTEGVVSFSVFIYGFAIELIQHYFITDRHFDIYDVLANGVGVVLGYTFFYLVIYKRI
jgi:VanZ family protein